MLLSPCPVCGTLKVRRSGVLVMTPHSVGTTCNRLLLLHRVTQWWSSLRPFRGRLTRSGKTEHPDCSMAGTGPARCLRTKAFPYSQWSAGSTIVRETATAVYVASVLNRFRNLQAQNWWSEWIPSRSRKGWVYCYLDSGAAFVQKDKARLCAGLRVHGD